MTKKILVIYISAFALLFLFGCSSATEFIISEEQMPTFKAKTVDIIDKTTTENISAETIEIFESRLKKKLLDDGLFQRGDDLKIEYVFFQGDHGSPLLSCCLTPFALGFVGVKGFFWVQIKLTNSKGDILRILEIKDSINYNIFNLWGITSSYNDLLEKNADVISSYIILHFN